MTEPLRLSKLMAARGLCSRREADSYIERGWVLVDGQPVNVLGTKVSPDCDIRLVREAGEVQAQRVTVLLNKPIGFVSGQPEPGYEPAVTLIRADTRWMEDRGPAYRADWLRGIAPAGRLDIDSTGLLVLTQDGRIARQLIGEDSDIEKEYLVRVDGQFSHAMHPDAIKWLNHGLSLDGKRLKPARVSWQNDDQLRFILKEGKKRQIRRMCELVGLHVLGLKRVRIGRIMLGHLPMGQWRLLGPNEGF